MVTGVKRSNLNIKKGSSVKLEGERLSKKDGVSKVQLLAVNIKELEILYSLIVKALRYMPNTFESMQVHGRLRNMSKVIGELTNEPRNLDRKLKKIEQSRKDNL